MKNGVPTVPLGELLTKSENWVDIMPDQQYRQVTVRLWGKGVMLRGEVSGAEIAASRQLMVKPLQFILSRIDARNGAFGLIPEELDEAVVSSDFPVFTLDHSRISPKFLNWMSKTTDFVHLCKAASEGTTNRVRLKEDRFLAAEILLPPLEEQRRIVARIEELAARIEEARGLRQEILTQLQSVLSITYDEIIIGAKNLPMAEVAPLKRRPVQIDFSEDYHELGIRSFGKGTFHKPSINGGSLGTKRIFRIETGDLLFNIVFAWEGAIAVAKQEDQGRVGSHRFLTCVPKEGLTTSPFLCFHFLSRQGLQQLGDASPGSAGRNRTLGMQTLEAIQVPVPPIEKQIWFNNLQAKVDALKQLQADTRAELDSLLPSILDKAFKGELV